ncbi:MAG: hypothetical protein AAGB97_04520 [Dehalococcoidia bacterium]
MKKNRFSKSILRGTKGHTPGIIRMVLALLASALVVFFSMVEGSAMSRLFSLFFIFPAVLLGVLGGIFGVWKRRLGGGMMLVASILFIIPVLLGEMWGLLALLTLVGCGISAKWHSYD